MIKQKYNAKFKIDFNNRQLDKVSSYFFTLSHLTVGSILIKLFDVGKSEILSNSDKEVLWVGVIFSIMCFLAGLISAGYTTNNLKK